MLNFYLVDDDPAVLELERGLIEAAGHQAWSSSSSIEALTEIPAKRPDCVIVDIMMPGMDGLELCRRLRENDELRLCKIIVVSGKSYDFDRRRAREFGADGFIGKPVDPETFMDELEGVIADNVSVHFWGVRGTLPVPGRRTLRYGGNTPCVGLVFEGGPFFIFDAGSGIKELSNHLVSQKPPRVSAKVFISHPHWDHINAFPLFAPLYIPGNEFEVCGPVQGPLGMRELIGKQMDSVHFPITMREFGASVSFRDLTEGQFEFEGVAVETLLLNHPGNCLGYRVNHGEISICYITDNELYPADLAQHDPRYVARLTDFVRNADVLITDTTYLDEEYERRVGWGHSSVEQVAKLAHAADVSTLFLFHHDPDQGDEQIDAKLAQARGHLAALDSRVTCRAPAEGDVFRL